MNKKKLIQYLPYTTFFLALISMFSSLFFSEVMKLTPCVLCWYQRICMYPLVAISAVGILRRDYRNLPFYILPLSIAGLLIAFYHNLLYYKILPESYAPCVNGVSCTTKQIELFGFITIPFMSFIAFALITSCMIIYLKNHRKHDKRS
jgi:disulfide bond formation protein DsbB